MPKSRFAPCLLGVILCALAAAAPLAAADEKPSSKVEERQKFHPRRLGMEPAARSAAFQRRQEMEKASAIAAIRFRNVGPEIQGGRVVEIAAPAKHPDSLVVAFASGGLWRTDNRGGAWTPLFDAQPTLTIGSFAIADPEGQIIYVGTGESNSSRTSYSGTGLYKTTDGGKSWKAVGLTDTHHIGKVLADPRDPETVYVAAAGHLYTENPERGVFVTRDGGKTWTKTLFVDDRTGAIDLVQDPKSPDVLYAATWERARTAANFLESGPGSGIWKSMDSGKTWKRLSGGFPTGPAVGRIGIAIAPSRHETLYAVLDNQARRPDTEPVDEETPPGELTPRRLKKLTADGFARLDDAVVTRFLRRAGFPRSLKAARLKKDVKAGKITVADLVAYMTDADRNLFDNDLVATEVYRSDDGGGSWKRTHDTRFDRVFYTFGYYFGRVAVDPADAERIYIVGVPFLSSTDGGKTWKGLGGRGVHGDYHAIFIDPAAPQRMAIGNDGGVNLSYDYGETWTKLNNLPVGQLTMIAVDSADPYNIVGGLQDNGVMRGPSNYRYGKSDPQAWKSIYGGDGSCVVIDPKDPNLIYAASQFGFASRLNLKTSERAAVRPRPDFSAKKREKALRYNWIAPFLLSPHSRDILYFGTNRLYRSFDRGDTWTPISEDLTSNPEQGDVPFGTITSVSESPKKFGVLYAGTDEGKVWGTKDGGATWADLSRGLAKDRWVTRVLASRFDEGTVYVTQSGYRNDEFAPYVFRSADFGRTWQSLAGGLPAEPVNVVREDPKASHLLYLGTDSGVFVSLDRGATWTPMSSGLPRVAVQDLVVEPRSGDLVVGTHGRSVFIAEAAPLRKLKGAVPSEALHAFPVKSVKVGLRRGYGEDPWTPFFRVDPSIRIAYWAQGAEPVKLAVKDENGMTWKELDGTSLKGMNVVEYDLSADPRLADAAEAKARDKALAKEKEREKEKDKDKEKDTEKEKDKSKAEEDGKQHASDPAAAAPPKGEKPPASAAAASAAAKKPAADEDEEDDDDSAKPEDDKPPAAGPAKPLDPELHALLADPLRASRKRYLPPGKYSVEIRSGKTVAKTDLKVEAEREGGFGAEDRD